MERKDLEQLRALRQELLTLQEKYLATPKTEAVADTYGDYRTGIKRTKVVSGMSSKRSDSLRHKMEHKEAVLSLRVEEMEDWLDGIEDSEMRDILRLYYVMGLSQEEIGYRKGYSREGITKKLDRFWKCTAITQE